MRQPYCPPSHTLPPELAVHGEERNFSAHQWLHFEQKKPSLIHWQPQREGMVAAWLRLDFGWRRRPSQSIRCRDERARRHSRVLRGTRADRRSTLNLWQLLSRGRMMAGRKEVEQRRPSEIKGARIKGLSPPSSFFPLTGQRGVGRRRLEWKLNGSDICMVSLWRTSSSSSALS